jgi:hypothetical protein
LHILQIALAATTKAIEEQYQTALNRMLGTARSLNAEIPQRNTKVH